MELFYDPRAISLRHGRYIDDLRRLFVFHGLSCGSPRHLSALASKLELSKPLRTDLSSLIRSTRDLAGDLTADEMLGILAVSIGGSDFVLEPSQSPLLSRAVTLLQLLLTGIGGWSETDDFAAPSLPASAAGLHTANELSRDQQTPDIANRHESAPHKSAPHESAPHESAPSKSPFPEPPPPESAPGVDVRAFVRGSDLPPQPHALRRELLSEIVVRPAAPDPPAAIEPRPDPQVSRPEPVRQPAIERTEPPLDPRLEQVLHGLTQHLQQMDRRIAELEPRLAEALSPAAAALPPAAVAAPRQDPPTPASFRPETPAPQPRSDRTPTEPPRTEPRPPAPASRPAPPASFRTNTEAEPRRTGVLLPAAAAAVLLIAAVTEAVHLHHKSHAGIAVAPVTHPSAAIEQASIAPTPAPLPQTTAPAPEPAPEPASPATPQTLPERVAGKRSAMPTHEPRIEELPAEATASTNPRRISPATLPPANPAEASSPQTDPAETASRQMPLVIPEATMDHQIVSTRKPVYPAAALEQHLEGTVVLNAVIDKDGSVRRMDVVGGPPPLINSAIAASTWRRYRPFLVHGRPVEVETRITVNYLLPASLNR